MMINFELKGVLDKLRHTFCRPFRKHLILRDVFIDDGEYTIEYEYECPYCGHRFMTMHLQPRFSCFNCSKTSKEATMENILEVL